MRLIDADAFQEDLNEIALKSAAGSYQNIPIRNIKILLDKVPTVKEKSYAMGYQDGLEDGLNGIRLQGKWVISLTPKKKRVFKCDKCHAVSIQGRTNFCPFCGSEMINGGTK